MSLQLWSPLSEMEKMLKSFHLSSQRSDKDELINPDWMPELDIHEDDNSFSVNVELPGVKKEDIEINCENNMLSIKGSKHSEKKVEGKKRHRVERQYGSFVRKFTLPRTVDSENIGAEFKDGVLSVKITKLKIEHKSPKAIEVK